MASCPQRTIRRRHVDDPAPPIGIPLVGTADSLKLTDAELDTARRFEKQNGITLYRYTEDGTAKKNSAFEFVDSWGRYYDQLGDPNTSANWSQQKANFLDQIKKHLLKPGFTIIDLTGFSDSQIREVSDYIKNNVPKDSQSRIIRVGF